MRCALCPGAVRAGFSVVETRRRSISEGGAVAMHSVIQRPFSSVTAFGRRSRLARSVALGGVVLGCAVAAPAGAAAARYTITDLGSLGAGAPTGGQSTPLAK
jgi:hypothetical protein